jgi:hypothetical protein
MKDKIYFFTKDIFSHIFFGYIFWVIKEFRVLLGFFELKILERIWQISMFEMLRHYLEMWQHQYSPAILGEIQQTIGRFTQNTKIKDNKVIFHFICGLGAFTNGISKFQKQIDTLNDRREKYLSIRDFMSFLEQEYDMNSESRFVKNARDFHILLRSDQIKKGSKDLFASQQDFDYMETIFPISGSSAQTRITDWVYLFYTEGSKSLELEWIKYYEKVILKI